MQVNTCLTSLNMRSNKQITDKGWADFAKGLAVSIRVTSVDLGCNEIGNEGAVAMAKMLEVGLNPC